MHTCCTALRSQEVLHLRLAHSRARTRAAYPVTGTIVLEPGQVRFRAGSGCALDVRQRVDQGEESRKEKERKEERRLCLPARLSVISRIQLPSWTNRRPPRQRASACRSRRGEPKRERAEGRTRTVPACELVGDLEIIVAILDEQPAAAPRVWHVIQIGP
jgi:hypothetical protein